MRDAFFCWDLAGLRLAHDRALRASDAPALRGIEAQREAAADLAAQLLGAGSVADRSLTGVAKAPADQLAVLARWRDRLRAYGRAGIGFGTTADEARQAAAESVKRRGEPVLWSPLLVASQGDLEKSVAGAAPLRDPCDNPDPATPLADVVQRLRDHAAGQSRREAHAEHQRAADLQGRREAAYQRLRALDQDGTLRLMQSQHPEQYALTMELVGHLRDALADPVAIQQDELGKAWSFRGLPIPHGRKRPPPVPVGTVEGGKERVETEDGEAWRSVRGGKVAADRPAVVGGRRGYVTSAQHPEG